MTTEDEQATLERKDDIDGLTTGFIIKLKLGITFNSADTTSYGVL